IEALEPRVDIDRSLSSPTPTSPPTCRLRAFAGFGVVGRWRGHDARAELVGAREHTVVPHAVNAAGWDQRGEASEQLGAVGDSAATTAGIRLAKRQLDAAVGAPRDTFGGLRDAGCSAGGARARRGRRTARTWQRGARSRRPART